MPPGKVVSLMEMFHIFVEVTGLLLQLLVYRRMHRRMP